MRWSKSGAKPARTPISTDPVGTAVQPLARLGSDRGGLATIQYQSGSRDLLWVANLQANQIAIQTTVIKTRNRQRANRISLHLALGGSFAALATYYRRPSVARGGSPSDWGAGDSGNAGPRRHAMRSRRQPPRHAGHHPDPDGSKLVGKDWLFAELEDRLDEDSMPTTLLSRPGTHMLRKARSGLGVEVEYLMHTGIT